MSKKNCLNCGSRNLEPFLDLGKQPNGNDFPLREEIAKEETYPFVMCVCTNCWQVQLETFPPVQKMFSHHPYLSGLNQPVIEHFENLAPHIIHKFNMKPNSLVFDIGANDGTLLSKFRDQGMQVLGIDPCHDTFEVAHESGIEMIRDFWTLESAKTLRAREVFPDLIMAAAVFYHIEDIHGFVQGLDEVMGEETVFCTQCVYMKDVIEKLQFDHFYHEHTMMHAITPLKRLFEQYGFRLLDVELSAIHGGSFLLYVARHSSKWPTSDAVDRQIAEEGDAALDVMDTYHLFHQQVDDNKRQMIRLLKEISDEGKTIYGLGAPLKSSTLLNYYGIGPDLVSYLVEVNPRKVGRVSPGTHIPIIHENDIKELPDYFLLLTWNFKEFFIEKYHKYLQNGGKFIIPHSTLEIIQG